MSTPPSSSIFSSYALQDASTSSASPLGTKVFALSILALLVLLQNTFGAENAKNSLNGLVLLNLLSSLMLVFAGNYVQMLVAVGVCDVLVFSAVNNIEAKKKYIYANFLADIGLVSMRERAQNLGGRFAVNSAPGAGTTVEVIIPCKKLQEGNSWTS